MGRRRLNKCDTQNTIKTETANRDRVLRMPARSQTADRAGRHSDTADRHRDLALPGLRQQTDTAMQQTDTAIQQTDTETWQACAALVLAPLDSERSS